MFLLFFQLATCLVEKLTAENEYKSVSYVLSDANTVHFIQSEVKERIGNSSFLPVGDDMVLTRISVYKKDGELGNKHSLLYQDEKSSEKNTFFFTTPSRDIYYIVLEVIFDSDDEKLNLGIDYKIYPGEANRPGIVSANDVEVSKAENLIENVLDFVRKNISIQNMDESDDHVYKKLYEEIMRKSVYVFILKILATGFTLYYANKKTKSFYANQGFIEPKP
ncbi:hypothetical protein GINT2_002298 [Glugoides intestinalis]